MIFQIAREGNEWTANEFLNGWGSEIAPFFQTGMYHQLADKESLPVGTYLFCDIEIATNLQRKVLAQIWDQLEAHGGSRLYNHPIRAKSRYDLLRALHDVGINDFRAFRANEIPSDLRFPVFLRIEADHWGSRTPLLDNWDDLDHWLTKAALGINDPSQLLVTEFADTKGEDGLYRKYSAFFIGGRIVPRHIHFSQNWMLKMPDIANAATLAEEDAFMSDVPYREELRRVFDLANIDYGRADFAFKNGRIQVWEINTNPTLTLLERDYVPGVVPTQKRFAALMVDAFKEVNLAPSTESVPIRLRYPDRAGRASLR